MFPDHGFVRPTPRRRARAAISQALLALATLLTACSGRLDWRELQWPEGGFAVLLPTRPSKESRPVRIGGHTLQLTVLPARVEPFVYGVGYADLPGVFDSAARESLAAAARDSLLSNIAGAASNERIARLGEFPCREFEAEGTIEQRTLVMAARVCITDKRYYQLVAIAPKSRAADMDATLFLGSLRLLE
jgi:hypothetical protein